MVQDLWIINEAVVSLHPTVTYPYVILGEVPPSAKWFTVLDLKDAFFAYHWLKNPNILLPSNGRLQEKNTNRCLGKYYLRGSEIAPTYLDRPVAGSPRSGPGPNGRILQYVDDLLISPDEKNAHNMQFRF